jgi:hypothetical protein
MPKVFGELPIQTVSSCVGIIERQTRPGAGKALHDVDLEVCLRRTEAASVYILLKQELLCKIVDPQEEVVEDRNSTIVSSSGQFSFYLTNNIL